jgi:ATP-dependent protease ClpP protease subunit
MRRAGGERVEWPREDSFTSRICCGSGASAASCICVAVSNQMSKFSTLLCHTSCCATFTSGCTALHSIAQHCTALHSMTFHTACSTNRFHNKSPLRKARFLESGRRR